MNPQYLVPRARVSDADRQRLVSKLVATRQAEKELKFALQAQGADARRGLPQRPKTKEK